MELNVKNYKSFIPKIKNSGSICLGKYAVMAMTDYNIGSNHILPTNGSAKYSSGVSVNEFYKRISYINLSKKGIESLGPSVITLANYEGLAAHAQSIKKRLKGEDKFWQKKKIFWSLKERFLTYLPNAMFRVKC